MSGNSPFACRTAIFAHVPVPQGQRSSAPVQVAGSSQERSPVNLRLEKAGDDRALIAMELHQAFGLEPFERLADGDLADVE